MASADVLKSFRTFTNDRENVEYVLAKQESTVTLKDVQNDPINLNSFAKN